MIRAFKKINYTLSERFAALVYAIWKRLLRWNSSASFLSLEEKYNLIEPAVDCRDIQTLLVYPSVVGGHLTGVLN